MRQHEVKVFINNAGFGLAGSFSGTDLSREQEMIDLNVYAMHTLMKIALKAMRPAGGGYILNVASSAGLFPGGPYMATYYATKAYVASLTQGVAEELRLEGSSMYVGCLCPGPVNTEFNKVAEVRFALKGITPERCVRAALKGMKRRKTVIVPTLTMKAAVLAGKLLPGRLTVKMVAGQQRKKLQGDA
jgi:short-subunit dehydrogenase